MSIVVQPSVPISIPTFPLSSDDIYARQFSSLSSSEPDSDDMSSASDTGGSSNRSKVRENRRAARRASREARAEARREGSAAVRASIDQKLTELNTQLSSLSSGSVEIVSGVPGLAGVKLWIADYDLTYIKPLEAELATMLAQGGLGAAMGTAPTLAMSDYKALALELSLYKDYLSQIQIWYDAEVLRYRAIMAEITLAVSVISGICALFSLSSDPSVSSFLSALSVACSSLNLLVGSL